MIIPIKQIILNEVTLGQLEKANKRFGKNIPKYKKQFLDLKPNSSLAQTVSAAGVKNIGAITVPKQSNLDKNFLSKSFSKHGLNISDNHPQNPGIYSKGNQLNAFGEVSKSRNGDPVIMDKYAHRASNAIVQNHELNEYKHLSSGSKLPQTQMGLRYGHHSLGKILGNERNIIITGDKRIKHAGQNFEKVRTGTGEFDYMKMFAPKNKNGEDMMPSYSDGPRLNRRHLRALYSKELGLPAGASRKDIYDTNKRAMTIKKDFINAN